MHFSMPMPPRARLSCSWRYLFALTIAVTTNFGLPRAYTADTVTLSAVDRGWYRSDGSHDPSNDNYIVGNTNGTEYRDFFVFDLASVTQPIVAASLRLWNPSNGYTNTSVDSPGFERYTLYDVTTNVTTLRSGQGGSSAFLDLGNGVTFGGYAATSADNNAYVTVPLNATGVAALNAANGLFAVGGAITTLNGDWNDEEYFFGWTYGNDATELILTVPEPSTFALALAGLLGGVWVITHRRRRTPPTCVRVAAPAILLVSLLHAHARGEIVSFQLTASMTSASPAGG